MQFDLFANLTRSRLHHAPCAPVYRFAQDKHPPDRQIRRNDPHAELRGKRCAEYAPALGAGAGPVRTYCGINVQSCSGAVLILPVGSTPPRAGHRRCSTIETYTSTGRFRLRRDSVVIPAPESAAKWSLVPRYSAKKLPHSSVGSAYSLDLLSCRRTPSPFRLAATATSGHVKGNAITRIYAPTSISARRPSRQADQSLVPSVAAPMACGHGDHRR